MLISFEGIDGSGKSTQIARLKEALEDRNIATAIFRDPGGTAVSEKVRELLLGDDADIAPVTELLLFSAARAQLINQQVQPLLRQGSIVILDRFYDSTTAYQGYGRQSVPLDDIARINKVASNGVAPDLTFYLNISLADARERTQQSFKDRMERSGTAFYENVIAGFNALAKSEPRIKTLDATKSAEAIHREIWKYVQKGL